MRLESGAGRGTRLAAPLAALALLSCSAALAGCSSAEEEPEALLPEPVPNVELERPGFRLLHPEDWSVDDSVPGHDPDRFFFLAGPDGATVAFMILDEAAEPAQLAATMAHDHGLEDAREKPFDRWGRFTGVGIDIHGDNEAGVPAGMRVFAWSGAARSFLVAESYVEYGYAAARPGFDAIELSFSLRGEDERWPAVSLGTPIEDTGERLLVRAGFQMRFPADWSVDADAPDYDPDRFFTLLTPYASSWMVVQLLDGQTDAQKVLNDARAGLEPILETLRSETAFPRWGRLEGTGLELKGDVAGLPATLRVFAHAADGRALLITEFLYDELKDELEPAFRSVAASFEFRS
jgi:hypothetical protein